MFDLAERFGCPPFPGPVVRWPARLVREAGRWSDRRWNRPSLTDQYLIQLTQHVSAGNGVVLSAEDLRLKFGRDDEDDGLTPEERTRHSLQHDFGGAFAGPGVEHRRRSRAEAREINPFLNGSLK